MPLGTTTFDAAGGAVKDLFGYFAAESQQEGYYHQIRGYHTAARYARQQKEFTRQSTEIKLHQADRDIYQGMGRATQSVSDSGFQLSGSGLDILRDSASQGALTKQVITQQGLITEEGFEAQHDAYIAMAQAARSAADAAETAGIGHLIGMGFKAATSIATLLPA